MRVPRWLWMVLLIGGAGCLLVTQVGCPPSQPEPTVVGTSPTLTGETAETPEAPAPGEEPDEAAPKEQPKEAAADEKPEAAAAAPKEAAAAGTPYTVKVPLGLPELKIPADNPMTEEKIALGKKLYFDKRLSRDGTVSCATCHDPKLAWTEHKPTSEGIKGQFGNMNSPTVINSAYAEVQFWDGRAATLEEQAVGPMENPVEMGHTLSELVTELGTLPEYKEAFQQVFGTGPTQDGLAKAIAAFERTILSGNSPYDKFEAGDKAALNDAQKRGMELFESSGCADCHAQPMFSNYRFYNAGIGMDKEKPDEGRKAVTGKDSDLGKFRVAPLREVANTWPYFHDGSVEKLEDAVKIMAQGGKPNDNLSPMMKAVGDKKLTEENIKDLVEFLKALSGEYPVVEG
ncbi:MAG: c-type cytochrome [Pirellulaceae bacterium]|nr:c-type cytochrome [Pirellulaceae bacterium]